MTNTLFSLSELNLPMLSTLPLTQTVLQTGNLPLPNMFVAKYSLTEEERIKIYWTFHR